MTQEFKIKKVAILVADGLEQVDMTKPKQALEQAGAQTYIISPQADCVQGWDHFGKGDSFWDVLLNRANPADYDALLLPTGIANPDQLQANDQALEFIKSFFNAGKPIAVICHGPWTLIVK